MNKKIIIGVVVIIVLPIAYWLLSPFWRNVELNEELPVSTTSATPKDNLMMMDASAKANFEQETMKMKGEVMMKTEVMPAMQPAVISKAKMIERAHEVEGDALFVTSGNDTYLRFENLNTVNGPDLRVYLSADLSNEDIIDLGPIRATQGNVNYLIPAGTDISKYKNAMIWCRSFGVLFSYAQL